MTSVLVLSVCAQGSNQTQVPTKPLSRTPLNAGVIQGNTYKNSSLGLELTPAPSLQFSAPEMKGTPGSVPLLVTIAAWGTLSWTSANGGTVFYADDLGYYPENRRSTKAYVDRVIRAQKDQGLESVEGMADEQLGGVAFSRIGFRDFSRYEVDFVKACDAYAFVFIFVGPDSKSANRLIAQADVKLDMKESGCGGPAQHNSQQ